MIPKPHPGRPRLPGTRMYAARLATLLLALAVAPCVHADQFEYLELRQAQAALRLLHAGDVVHLYCAPCGEAQSRRKTVHAPGIDRVWDRRGSAAVYVDGDRRGYWVVELDDGAIDLAYVYVRRGRRWRNLAMEIGLSPSGVPATLPTDAIGRRWQCAGRDDNPDLSEAGRHDPCAD